MVSPLSFELRSPSHSHGITGLHVRSLQDWLYLRRVSTSLSPCPALIPSLRRPGQATRMLAQVNPVALFQLQKLTRSTCTGANLPRPLSQFLPEEQGAPLVLRLMRRTLKPTLPQDPVFISRRGGENEQRGVYSADVVLETVPRSAEGRPVLWRKRAPTGPVSARETKGKTRSHSLSSLNHSS